MKSRRKSVTFSGNEYSVSYEEYNGDMKIVIGNGGQYDYREEVSLSFENFREVLEMLGELTDYLVSVEVI